MGYSIRIEQIGAAGTPGVPAASYEVATELEAIALATYEVDAGRSRARRVATVLDGAGVLILTYAGRADAEDGAAPDLR